MFAVLTKFELKLQLRNVITLFFALAFPLMMLLLFGAMYGNEPSEFTGGYGAVDLMVPSYTCMIVAVTGIMSLPLTVPPRTSGASPPLPACNLGSPSVNNVLAGIALLLVVADWSIMCNSCGTCRTTVRLSLGYSMFSLGLMIAGGAPNGRAASALAYLVYFPMLFLSGASVPLYIMPKSIVKIANILPLTYGVRLLTGVWLGGALWDYGRELLVLLGVTILSVALSIRFFKWE